MESSFTTPGWMQLIWNPEQGQRGRNTLVLSVRRNSPQVGGTDLIQRREVSQ